MTEIIEQDISLHPRMKNLANPPTRYERLTVIGFVGVDKKSKSIYYWKCLCDCGNTITTRADSLKRKATKSCGCSSKDHLIKMNTKHGNTNINGYELWRSMIRRCYEENSISYKNYGNRNIKVCDRWLDFDNFKTDMLPKPNKDASLDRINNNEDYCPENCRWATKKEQANNRSNSRFLEYDGQKLTVSQWADKYNINQNRIHSRLKNGWTVEEAITTPLREKRICLK